MTIAYIGFSSIFGNSHSGAVRSGISQSDFTFDLLSEIQDAKYFVCLDKKIDFHEIKKYIPIILRTGYLNLLFDSINFFFRIQKEGPFKKIVIYHSFIYFPIILLLRLSGKAVTLQVNEIFSRAGSHESFMHFIIEKIIFYLASDYILAASPISLYLPKYKINKQLVIPLIPGPIYYKKNNLLKRCQGSYRLVYAGVIDKKKVGGAFIAVELAKRLDDSIFTIDIYGYGQDEDVEDLLREIKLCNLSSDTKVRYMGSLSQRELVDELRNYDIGLATQYIGTAFSASSFPSKILTYLSADLYTISASSLAVSQWEFRDSLYIYGEKDLSDLTHHLRSIDFIDKNIINQQVGLVRASMASNLEKLLR